MKCSVLIATFPYGHVLDDRLSHWISFSLIPSIMRDKERCGEHRIETFSCWSEADTPIPMLRNKCLRGALQHNYDFLLMLDSDNIPDFHLSWPGTKPFWETTFDFMWQHRHAGYADPDLKGQVAHGPCVVFAPYCGPPPIENPFTFDWTNRSTGNAFQDFALDMPSRIDAARRTGFHRAAAGPTGCMLIDMLAIKRLQQFKKLNPQLKQCPFYYEWKDEWEDQKASTEDVAFTRDLNYAGVPLYCNYDSWAAHVKPKVVTKPENLDVNWVPRFLSDSHTLGSQLGIIPERKQDTRNIRKTNTFPELPKGFPIELVRKIPHPAEVDEPDPIRFEEDEAEFAKVGLNGEA